MTNNSIIFATKQGRAIRIPVDSIPLKSLIDSKGRQKTRKSCGVKVINLKPEDQVCKIAVVPNIEPAADSD